MPIRRGKTAEIGDKRERGNGEKLLPRLGFGFTLMDDCGFRLETLSWMHTNFYHSFLPLSVETKPAFHRGACFQRSKEAMTGQRIGGKRRVHPFFLSFSPIRSGLKSKWTVQLPTFSKLKMDAVLSFDYENKNDSVLCLAMNEMTMMMPFTVLILKFSQRFGDDSFLNFVNLS